MPQLDISTYAPQLVWLVITFGFLYLLMARSLLPRVGEVIEERQDRIDDDLETAEKVKEESQKLEETYEHLLTDARKEASDYLKGEREKVEQKLAGRRKKMEAEIADRVAKAEERIAKAKKEALGDLDAMSADACVAIYAKLTGTRLKKEQAKKAVRKELGAKR